MSHGHSHGGGTCAHEHEPESDIADGWSLYQYVWTGNKRRNCQTKTKNIDTLIQKLLVA